MENYISKEVKEGLEKELEELKSKRKGIAQRLKKSAAYGDLKENSEYHEARGAKEELEKTILELGCKIKNSKIKEKSFSSNKVDIYSKVKIKGSEGESDFILVSSEEVDINKGKISYESPIGEGLLGKKKGDEVKIKTPSGEDVYKIINIE